MVGQGVLAGALRRSVIAAALVGLSAALPIAARAQPVERNLPPVYQAPRTALTAPAIPGSIDDDRSLGASLRAIVLLGPTDAVATQAANPGVGAALVARLNRPRPGRALARFLGQPLSRKLIGEVEAAIVREYRRQGFPFVEVSTPAQEITGGVLQIRVVEFHVGKLTVTGVGPGQAAWIARRIRAQPGDEVSSPALLQDLDWLNRYPGRVVSPVFSPGAQLGDTDLDLQVTRLRPWSLSAGYADSGSPDTGLDRIFVAGSVGLHLLTDEIFSAQVTGSPDFWAAGGRPFGDPHPLYESAATRLVVATAPRQDIELTLNAVETNEAASPFATRQDTVEATLGYRSALANFLPAPGDLTLGVEATRQSRLTFFGGVQVIRAGVDVFQLFADWSDHWNDRLGSVSADFSLHGSPGGVDDRNTGAAFANFTTGRVTSADYLYGTADISRQTTLSSDLRLVTELVGQYAFRPLPESQQIALGGQTAVRGYTLDDGAWDSGLILRDELRPTPMPVLPGAPVAIGFAPFVFVDVGYGHDKALADDTWLAAAGLGAELRLGKCAFAALDAAWPLESAASTRAGHPRVDVKLSVAY